MCPSLGLPIEKFQREVGDNSYQFVGDDGVLREDIVTLNSCDSSPRVLPGIASGRNYDWSLVCITTDITLLAKQEVKGEEPT